MDDKRYQPISQIGRPFLRSLGVYDYFRGCAWTKAIDRIEQERISSFFYLSAVKYLYFCRDNELTILDLQEAKWHLQYWLSSSVPKNPRVRRRAEETVIAIEKYLAEIKPNEQ